MIAQMIGWVLAQLHPAKRWMWMVTYPWKLEAGIIIPMMAAKGGLGHLLMGTEIP